MTYHQWTNILVRLGLVCFFLVSHMALAETALASIASPPVAQDTLVEHQTLPNGLEIYVYEDHSTPVVSVNLWYKVGSRDEPPGLYGMAHLLEHMMFNGSENIPKNGHAHLIDAVGGMLNAYTSNDVTVYWNKVPSDQLGAVLKLEAERMTNLLITPDKVEIEKEVVKEEFRVGFENDALGFALDKLLATSLEGTPYAWTPAGAIHSIDAITAKDLQGFYESYYTPNNAVLVVAGDTDIEEVTRLAQDAFGFITSKTIPSRSVVRLPERQQPTYIDLTMPLQLPAILGGYVIPGTASEDNTALQMASLILSAGQSSRLHQRLVRESNLAVAAAGYAQPFRDAGLFLNLAFHLEHQDPDTVIQGMRDEIEGLAANPPTQAELAKARNLLAASYAFSLDSLDGIANAIGYAVVQGRGIEEFEAGLDDYFRVTSEDIQNVVYKYLQPENLTVFRVRPGALEEEVIGEISDGLVTTAVDLAVRQEEAASSAVTLQELADEFGMLSPQAERVSLPPITHFRLDNGLDVWLIHRPQQPIAALQLMLPVGSYEDPQGKAGLANFTATMLRQGTDTRSAEDISEIIDAVGGSLSAWADSDTTAIVSEVVSKDVALAIELMADITINAAFPEGEVETMRQQFLGSLYRRRDSASALANDQAIAYFYGDEHPLGRPATIGSIQSIQAEDLAAFARQFYGPQGALLVAAGDIDLADFRRSVETEFGKWQTSVTYSGTREEGVPEPASHPRLLFIEKPGQTQAQIRMVQRGPTRTTSDWIPLELYNYILGGGGFSSRLMQVIRTELGETYGISSGYKAGQFHGIFMIATFTSNEKLYDTMAVIKGELERFAQDGITKEELQYAKASRIGGYPLRFETLGGTASAITNGLRFRSLEEIENYPLLVESQSKADVEAAIAKHFDPNDFTIVLLGDPSITNQVNQIAKLYGITPDDIDQIHWQAIK
ncbi:MAG: insulinase family protein [Firmicutes bacterium]|nr:insulinase family protein [Bacillota bacterium]